MMNARAGLVWLFAAGAWVGVVVSMLMGCTGGVHDLSNAPPPATIDAGVDAQSSTPEQRARCAVRLSISITGQSPSAALLQSMSPQASIDELLATPQFIERFASFINASFNTGPGARPSEDAPYWLAREILSKRLPWRELFVGPYSVDVASGEPADSVNVVVTPEPNGLGYFRSRPWQLRYAGNEATGIKLATAYRIMQNVIGLTLTPTTNAPGADVSATGRTATACAGCHYNGPFALDKVASVLTVRSGSGNNIVFAPPTATSAEVLGGVTIVDDKSLVQSLVGSDSYRFATCRLAFEFLYGRAESSCEAALFDRCVDALQATGTMQSALSTIAGDASFCQ
jgi:hypothetical protein